MLNEHGLSAVSNSATSPAPEHHVMVADDQGVQSAPDVHCKRFTHALPKSGESGSSEASAPSPLDARSRSAVFAQRARRIAIAGEQ